MKSTDKLMHYAMPKYLQPKLVSDGKHDFIQFDTGDGNYVRYEIDLLGLCLLAADITLRIRNLHSESARRTTSEPVPQRSDGGA